jgi:hypothetical protein
MQEQKKYHKRKLAIIEMIESCTETIKREKSFIRNCPSTFALKNTRANIERYESIRKYLTERYNRN